MALDWRNLNQIGLSTLVVIIVMEHMTVFIELTALRGSVTKCVQPLIMISNKNVCVTFCNCVYSVDNGCKYTSLFGFQF